MNHIFKSPTWRVAAFTVLALVAGSTACKHEHGPTSHEGHAAGELRLDDGKRWTADTPTNAGFAALRSKSEAFRNAHPQPDAAARGVWAREIETGIDAILKACRMSGAAHDELHKLIAGLQSEAKAMRGGVEAESAAATARSHGLVRKYFEYFQ